MSGSPKLSRYRATENAALDDRHGVLDQASVRPSRFGLSQYTSKRLADLRARRAEMDQSDESPSDFQQKREARDTRETHSYTSRVGGSTLSDHKQDETPLRHSTADVSKSNKSEAVTITSASVPRPATRVATVSSTTGSVNVEMESYRSRRAEPTNEAPKSPKKISGSFDSNRLATKLDDSDHMDSYRSRRVASGTDQSRPGIDSSNERHRSEQTGYGRPIPSSFNDSVVKTGPDTRRDVRSTVTPNGSSTHVSLANNNMNTANAHLVTGSEHCMGFASLPEQVHRKAVRRGFDFTLMVVGETGLGKSTLISSLFLNSDFYKNRENPSVEERVTKTVEIELKKMEIEEKGIKLRLTIVDTPGFNDSLNGEESWRTIEEYIDKQFAQYFKDESGINRKNINDTRVHCCLYFVSPYGHGLRPIDIQFMKQLHQKVNIVPVIAKADTLTKMEMRRLKERVLEQISNNKIQIYTFPDCDSDEDEEFIQEDKELKASIPFAVIGSTTKVEVNGKKVRGRLYPWGIVEVDNPDHCDFTKLRQMLISTHMQDLKDMTRDVHYENYRAQYIKEHIISGQRERTKLKRESTQNIETVQYADHLLQAKEDEIQRMQEMLSKMKAQLDVNTRAAVNGVGRP